MNRSVVPTAEYQGLREPPCSSVAVPPTLLQGSARVQIKDMLQQDEDTLAKAWAELSRENRKLRLEATEHRNTIHNLRSLSKLQGLETERHRNISKGLAKKLNRKRSSRIPDCNDYVVMDCDAIRNMDNPQVRAMILRNDDGTYTH